jgi:hypothetical protein
MNDRERLADRVYDRQQFQLIERDIALEKTENECRRAIDIAIHRYNETLVRTRYNMFVSIMFSMIDNRQVKRKRVMMKENGDKRKNN